MMDARVEFPQTTLSAAMPVTSSRGLGAERTTALFAVALVPPLLAALYESGGSLIPLLGGSLAVGLGWTLLFSRLRGRPFNAYAIVAATVFALLVPSGVPLWQALLSLSFGVVIGEQVFGGRGYAFLHPAVAALAFLFFSFPASSLGDAGSTLVMIAVLPGAALLLATGLISWRVILGAILGTGAWLALKGEAFSPESVLTSALALGLVFLICEPVSAAATNAGRWAYGFLAGILLVLVGAAGSGTGAVDTVIFTALLASIFAPLIDRVAVHFNIRRRKRRQWPT